MTRYYAIQPVDAFRWTGGHDQTEDPLWLVDAMKTGTVVLMGAGTDGIRLAMPDQMGVRQMANPGDWLVLDAEGVIRRYKPLIFQLMFKEIMDAIGSPQTT